MNSKKNTQIKVKFEKIVFDKMTDALKKNTYDIAGFIIGIYLPQDQLFKVIGACFMSISNHIIFPFLAKLGGIINKGRERHNIDGWKIIGWIHTHLGREAFLSMADTQTYIDLYKFAQGEFLAIVVEPMNKEIKSYIFNKFDNNVEEIDISIENLEYTNEERKFVKNLGEQFISSKEIGEVIILPII